jgi:hypothetical protein
MATSKFFRLLLGRPVPDKEFDEANIPTADQKAAFPAGAGAGDQMVLNSDSRLPTADQKAALTGEGTPGSDNKYVTKDHLTSVVNNLDPQDSITHGVDYVKADAGAPSGTATDGEKCLNTNENKLYTYSSGWDAGAAISTGDRFCHKDTGSDTSGDSGTYTKSDKIYDWDGSSYTQITPNEGYFCWFEDEDKNYRHNGTNWVGETTTQQHNNMAGKQGGTTDEYYHLTSDQEAGVDAATPIDVSNPPATKADRDRVPVCLCFSYRGGFAASQNDVEIYEAAGSFQQVVMPSAGSIVKHTLQSSSARTAGSLTAEPTIDGTKVTASDLDLTIDDDPTNDAKAEVAPGTTNLTFTAGQKLGVKWTSDGDWAPVDSDIESRLYVVFDT